jgi:AhpD family alkylhydroperoxidase
MSTNTFPYWKLAPNAFNALNKLTETLETGSIDKKLQNLIYLRVSQINGCAYCTQLHGHDLRQDGETPERMDTLAAWKESPHFTHDERLALRWAEAVTCLKDQQVPKELFNDLKTCYSDTQIAELTFAIASINAWNRVAISMHQAV